MGRRPAFLQSRWMRLLCVLVLLREENQILLSGAAKSHQSVL